MLSRLSIVMLVALLLQGCGRETRASYQELAPGTAAAGAATILKSRELAGTDPTTLALSAIAQPEQPKPESVELHYPEPGRATVTLIIPTLDDSIRATKYRVDLRRANNQWQTEWIGQQWRCHPDRGHQNWSTELCL